MVALLHRLTLETWLQDPRFKEVIRFQRTDNPDQQMGSIVVECGHVQRGRPFVLSTRTRMTKPQARDWWRKLTREGWRRVDPQW